MKNILLLGNGFDLHYKLPTQYVDFLHVVNYLLNNRRTNSETIGDIFSQKLLQEADKFVAECYNAHQQTFDAVPLEKDDISEIIRLTENNIWFSYLSKVFNKDVGWIDFEKEISFVLKCFEKVFEKSTVDYFEEEEKHIQYIIELFKFYFNKDDLEKDITLGFCIVNPEYCIESPLGSGNNIIDKEKVVNRLYEELSDLSKALKLYLKCFVENTHELLKDDGTCKRIEIFSYIEKVITFNYTNTYEKLHYNNGTFHVHGNVNDEIVLGVNSDESDSLENINTTFVCFKKYFQRTFFETDRDYLRWMNEYVDAKTPYRLFTMGHSLDITDKDVIAELFHNSKEIIILYHSSEAKKSYIANLVKLFGKDGFDELKKNKKLIFMSLNQDLLSLSAFLSKESWDDFRDMFDGEQKKMIIV